MDYFKKLPGFIRTPSGLEWQILRKLPLYLLLGTMLPAVFVLILYGPEALEPQTLDKTIIVAISLVILHWTFMMVIAIAAFIIMLMKGPAYVADPYYPPDFNEADEDMK